MCATYKCRPENRVPPGDEPTPQRSGQTPRGLAEWARAVYGNARTLKLMRETLTTPSPPPRRRRRLRRLRVVESDSPESESESESAARRAADAESESESVGNLGRLIKFTTGSL